MKKSRKKISALFFFVSQRFSCTSLEKVVKLGKDGGVNITLLSWLIIRNMKGKATKVKKLVSKCQLMLLTLSLILIFNSSFSSENNRILNVGGRRNCGTGLQLIKDQQSCVSHFKGDNEGSQFPSSFSSYHVCNLDTSRSFQSDIFLSKKA